MRYVYDAYGKATVYTSTWTDPTSPITDGPLYCGYWFDAETALYQVRNRYYDSSLATFISRDPIGYKGGINLYEYVGDNPTDKTDPDGKAPWTGKYWGNYCGDDWCGGKDQDETKGGETAKVPATDEMDACCKAHDACLGGWDSSTGKSKCPEEKKKPKVCDEEMCSCLKNVDILKVKDKNPNVPLQEIARKLRIMQNLFCNVDIPGH